MGKRVFQQTLFIKEK